MHATASIPNQAQLAGRATGAMFFFLFGAVWLEGWATTAEAGATAFAGIAVLALVLLAVAWRRYRRYAPALAQEQGTPERRRARRVFNIVNAGQWTAIFILAQVLIHLGKGAWIIPMAIAVIGLHFLPLAHVFKNPPHYVMAWQWSRSPCCIRCSPTAARRRRWVSSAPDSSCGSAPHGHCAPDVIVLQHFAVILVIRAVAVQQGPVSVLY
ncbi:hypothetical protein C5614_24900 [Massilia phosphatilytica]|nr:hypothetical protein C5614_24900 [Massilia phosphatilytica]